MPLLWVMLWCACKKCNVMKLISYGSWFMSIQYCCCQHIGVTWTFYSCAMFATTTTFQCPPSQQPWVCFFIYFLMLFLLLFLPFWYWLQKNYWWSKNTFWHSYRANCIFLFDVGQMKSPIQNNCSKLWLRRVAGYFRRNETQINKREKRLYIFISALLSHKTHLYMCLHRLDQFHFPPDS